MRQNRRSGPTMTTDPRNRADASDAKLGPFRSVCYDAQPRGGGVKVLPEVELPGAVLRSPRSAKKVSAFAPSMRGIGGGSR